MLFAQKGACTPTQSGCLVLTLSMVTMIMVLSNVLHIFYIGKQDTDAAHTPMALRVVPNDNQLRVQQSIAQLQTQVHGLVTNLSEVHTMLQGLVASTEQVQNSNEHHLDVALSAVLNTTLVPVYVKPRGTAVIIEFRSNVPKFWPVVQTALDTIEREPKGEWQLVVIHGNANKAWITTSMPAELKHKVTLWHDTRIDFPDKCKYNQIRLQRQFWEQFETEFILNFEADASFNPKSRHMISDFYDWDYVGAPWSTSAQREWGMPDVGGNGGLVLSTRKMRIDVVDNCTINKSECEHEDIWFSACGKREYGDKYKFARDDVAKTFVVETVCYGDPIGVHKPSCVTTDLRKNFPLM